MAVLQNVPGTWGVGSFKIPDFGVTELLRMWTGKTPSAEATTRFNNPNVIRQVVGSTAPIRTFGTTNQPQITTQTTTSPVPSSPSPSGGEGLYLRNMNVGDVFEIGGRKARVVDPGKGIWEYLNVPGQDGMTDYEAQERENRIRSQIESGYGQYEQNLSNMMAQYPQWQQEDEALLEGSYGSQRQGIDQGKQAALTNLETSREQVRKRSRDSIAAQAQNLRNILKASQTQLSAMGAGDSSATERMLPYAYSKIGAREQGNIYRQANDQFAEIDKKTVDVQTQYDDQLRQVEQWKNSNLMAIRDKYQGQLQQIQQMKARLPLDKANALAGLETQLLNQAQQQLFAIEAQDRQFRQQLELNAQQQLAQLQNYKVQLAQSSKFNPVDIVYQNVRALGNMGFRGGGDQNYGYVNPALAKRKYDQYGNEIYS